MAFLPHSEDRRPRETANFAPNADRMRDAVSDVRGHAPIIRGVAATRLA
jgi:hypothetical protein